MQTKGSRIADMGIIEQPNTVLERKLSSDVNVKEHDGDSTPSDRTFTGVSGIVDWTDAEEKALVRRLDMILMPILVTAFFALQLDRGNIGNALTDFFFRDVGITQNQFNIGQQLLSAGIVLLEIPSNYILYRLGPTIWIGGQIVAWGLVATFQAFQKGLGAFLATRLLLGLCEAGFIPASLYTITTWYKRNETSTRFAVFFIGNMTAAATSGLLAYAILHMRGIAGLAGWQWLFILEGIFTVLVGFLFLAFFPTSTSNPVTSLGLRFFNEREAYILTTRILLDDPTKQKKAKSIQWKEIKGTLSNWRLYPHIIFTISCIAPSTTLLAYGPTLVNSFGYDRLKSNALVSVGYWCLLVMNLCLGKLADKTKLRGPLVLFGLTMWWTFVLASRLVITSKDKHLRYGLLVACYTFCVAWHPVNGAWMALNARSAGERSITMAILIMAANSSGIIGSQLFQAKDKPLYPVGWTVSVALISVGLVAAIVANLQYWILNRRAARHPEKETKRYMY